MFFVRQQGNQCGLHAIQNLFKSAAITRDDLHAACDAIHKQTGDPVSNHESFGGDWSVEAVCEAVRAHGYTVERAVQSKKGRAWTAAAMETLVQDPLFRGFLVHQPINHHFTCMRPEQVDSDRYLYYVDSQSSGPIRISSRLAMRRCLAAAYSWEPFVVKGPEMEYVSPVTSPVAVFHGVSSARQRRSTFKPSAEFLRDWANVSKTTTSTSEGRAASATAGGTAAVRDDRLGT